MSPTEAATDASKELRRQEKKSRKAERKRKAELLETVGAVAAAKEPTAVDATVKAKKDKKQKKDKPKESKKRAKVDGDLAAVLPEVASVDVKKTKAKKDKKESTGTVDLAKWYAEHDISIEDSKEGAAWSPAFTFAETGLDDKVLHITRDYERPTPIQSTCWPIALSGRDIIGIAETGSGKTMAFGIPALAHIQSMTKKQRTPTVLALAPTRELALQIGEQMDKAGTQCGVKSLVIFGGVPKDDQRRKLRAGVDVVVACPGRLLDLVQEGACDLSGVDFVILDEADRMLDMGFEKEVREIIGMTLARRQILMFSATWPTSIQKLAHEFLKTPVKVVVGSPDLGANANITQIVEVVEQYDKEAKVLQLLQQYHSSRTNRVLVFALYKKEAARLEQQLQRRGWNCIAIHGDMNQQARNNSFYKFKSGEIPLLIATDVAARGLDIPNVEYVINYTFPLTIEDYVHRIGRTGRAGKTGVAHTLFTVLDKPRAGELSNLLKQTGQPVPESLTAFGTTVKKKEHAAYGAFFKEVDTTVKATKITFESDDEEKQ